MNREKVPWWLWPNLLSLDAPLVAIAWAWMFARAWGVVSVPWELWITLGGTVWMIYVADRLIDIRKTKNRESLDKRHYFHDRFRAIFLAGVVLAGGWGVYSALWALAENVLYYGLFVIFLAGFYFLISLTRSGGEHTGISKNFVAGLTFAYGTAAGIHAYSPVFVFSEMLFSWEVLLFAGLCTINMTAIDFWELEGEDEEDAAALLATATLLIGGAAMYLSLNGDDFNKPLFYSVLVGAGGLNVLNRMRGQLTKDARRLWVDLVILAPVFTYWVWISFDGNRAT
ncbi:MAG: hypothetical protein ACON5N_16850 [Akkermansiaceae bacterium]